jgi:general secretion pathway protein H
MHTITVRPVRTVDRTKLPLMGLAEKPEMLREAPIRSPVGEPNDIHDSGSEAGYMLIEVVAALVLTTLLIAFIFPMTPFGTTPSRLLALVSSSASLLREARTAAVAGNTPVAARFDVARRRLQAGSDVVAVPADVDFSLTTGAACRKAEILFRPDGTNCGGLLRFGKGGRILRARVNWADGRIDVVEGE